MKSKAAVRRIVEELKVLYPNARCSLNYQKDYELLFAVRLSAQCTALGCGICILNLFLLRFTMNRAAAATSPQAAQQIAKASVPPRLLLICVAFYLGFTLPVFNPIAVVVPFAFPRLSALLLQGVAPSFRFLRNKAADVKQALEDENF